eukprot:gene38652-46987_t
MAKDNSNEDTEIASDAVEAPKAEVTLAAMPVAPNGGYGWVIVLASFFVHMFVLGNIYSFGLMGGLGAWSGQLADRYGNNVVIAMGAVMIGIGYFLASFSTALWHLYLTQGVIAVGIAVAGSGVGQFCMSQITGLLLCALLTKRVLPLVVATKSNSSSELFKDPKFVQLYIGVFFNVLGMYMPYTYLPLYAQRYGVSLSGSVLILSMVGISSAVGRIVIGLLADSWGKLGMLKLCMFGGGASTLCWM